MKQISFQEKKDSPVGKRVRAVGMVYFQNKDLIVAPPIQFDLFDNFASWKSFSVFSEMGSQWKSWYDDRFEVLYKQIRRKNFQMPLDSISKLYLFPMDTLSEISASVNQILTARISKNF